MDKLIKAIRKSVNLSQEEFARKLGTTPLSVNRWENGKTCPNKMAQVQLLDFCKRNNIDMFDFVVKQFSRKFFNGELIVYHGSKKGLHGKIGPKSREGCDFGKGFYLGTDPIQPLTLICGEEKPIFYTMKLNLTGLRVLKLEMNIDWAMVIAFSRGYMDEAKGSKIYKKYKKMIDGYDVIVGCIADDRMYRVMNSFFEKEITDVALINSLSALDLGYQYVCKSIKACSRLEILDKRELSPLELGILQDKSIARRKAGIEITEKVLRQYRREGRYFDEILGGDNDD